MRRLELSVYQGQIENRGVIQRLRRKILKASAQGECLLLDGEGLDTSIANLRELLRGYDPSKVKLAGFPIPILEAIQGDDDD